jgi:signal transduction histidine kinase
MGGLINLDLLSVAVVASGTIVLGFSIFYSDKKNVTNRLFFYFSLTTVAWSLLNYFAYLAPEQEQSLWLFRVVIATATWHSFLLYTLFYVFPKDKIVFPRWFKFGLVPLVSITSISNLTPLTFSKVASVTDIGNVSKIENGPGIFLFTSVIAFLVIGGIVMLVRKTLAAKVAERAQYKIVLLGISLTFALILVFNFVMPAFFNNSRFIPFGALFTFPFIAFTSYAILKHKLFNIKVAGVSLLVFALSVVTLLDILFADSTTLVIFRISALLLVLLVGVSLIKGVIREISTREKIQKLAKELEVLNKKLKKTDQAKSEFLSIAAHQLRTPLTGIKGYLSMFLEGDFGKIPKNQRTELEKIFISSDRLTRLIDVFLNVSRIETGRLELRLESVSIEQILDEVVVSIEQQAKDKKLKLTIQKPSKPLPKMMLDHDKLHDVMMNLVDNSIKYTKKGWVNVRLSSSKSLVVFEVRDSGIGIAPEEIDKLFEKFSRAEAVSRIHTGGSGLGLFIAKKIVEAHGGRVWAESNGEGKGSTFTFTLPIEEGEKKDLTPKVEA